MEDDGIVQAATRTTVGGRVLKLDAERGWVLVRTDSGMSGWTYLILHTAFAVAAAAFVQNRPIVLTYDDYKSGRFYGAHIEFP